MDKMCLKIKVEDLDETNTCGEESKIVKRCESPVFKCANQSKAIRVSHVDSSECDISSYQLNQSLKIRNSSKCDNVSSETGLLLSPNFSPPPVVPTSQFQPPLIHTIGTVAKNIPKSSLHKSQQLGGIFESLGMNNKDISWVSSMASPPPKTVPGSQFNTVEKATFLPEDKFQSIQPRALFSPSLDEDFGCHPITSESDNDVDDDDDVYKSSIRLSDVCATLKKLEFKSLDVEKKSVECVSPVIRAKKKKLENVKKKKSVLVISPDNKYEFSVGSLKSLEGNFMEDDSFQNMSFSCLDELCKTLVSEQSNSSRSSDCDKTVVSSKPFSKKFYSTKACDEVFTITSMNDLHSNIIALEEGDKCIPQGRKIDQSHTDKEIIRFDVLEQNYSETRDLPKEKNDQGNSGWEKVKQYLSESQLNVSDGEIFRTLENLEKTLVSQERLSGNEQGEEESVVSESSKLPTEDKGSLEKESGSRIPVETTRFSCQDFPAFTTASGSKISVSGKALNKAREILKDCWEEDEVDIKTSSSVDPVRTLKSTCEPEKAFENLIDTRTTASENKIQTFEEELKKAKPSGFECNEANESFGLGMKAFFKTGSGNPVKVSKESLERAKALMAECDKETKNFACTSFSTEICGFKTSSGKPIQVLPESLKKAKALMSECENDFNEEKGPKNVIGFSTGSGKAIQISMEALEKAKTFMKEFNEAKEEQPCDISESLEEQTVGSMGKGKVTWSMFKSTTKPPFPSFASAGETKVSISESSLDKAGDKIILWNQHIPSTTGNCDKPSEVSKENEINLFTSGIEEPSNWEEIIPNWLHVYNTSPSIASDRVDLSPIVSHEDGRQLKSEREYVVKSPVLGSKDRFYGKRKIRKLLSKENIKKASVKRTLELDFSAPFKKMKFEGVEVEVKAERELARKEQQKTIDEKQKVKPLLGSHLGRKTSERQISWMEATAGTSPKVHSDEVLKKMGVLEDVLKINVENAVSIRFKGEDFFGSDCRTNTKGIPTGDGCFLILDNDNRFGVEEVKKAFLASPGVQPNLLPDGWVENHYKWIIWKLANYEKSLPEYFARKSLTPNNVMVQLKYRYDREIDRNERSALKKILEKDDSSLKRMVLCVCGIKKVSVGETVGYELQLTDGWYSCPARCDAAMARLIEKGKLFVGTKLVTQGATLVNCEQGVSPLEMGEGVYMKIFTNSTRRIRWDTKLGFQKNPENFPISLGSILAQGGPISRIDVIVVRIYPILYMEKTLDGHHVTRNRKSEEKAEAEYRKIKEQRIEAICREVQSEIRSAQIERSLKSNRNNDNVKDCSQVTPTSSESSLQERISPSSEGNQNDCFTREMAEKVEKKLQQENLKNRNVTEFFRAKIVDLRKPNYNNPAVLSVWNSNEDLISLLAEGKVVSLLNVTISNSARIYQPLQINTTRQTHYRQISKTVKYPARVLTNLKDVSSQVSPAFEEVDLVGMVCYIQDLSYGSRMSQVVYLTDFEMNFVGIVFWGSSKDYGWENVLEISSVVACSNLQWKKNRNLQDVPSLYVNENSVFTVSPRQDYLREEMERLKKIIPKDLSTFISRCEEDLTNKLEDSKWRKNTSKNSSNDSITLKDIPPQMKPRLPNGFESKPTASSTPIKPFAERHLPANHDEAEPSPIQRRIEKLQSYGEPPSLIPLIIRNHGKKKFRKKA